MRSSNNCGRAVMMAAAVMAIAAASAFADSRSQDRTWRERGDRDSREDRVYRNHERVTSEGRVRSFRQERDGYRVELDRGRHSYWVPRSYVRGNGRNLRVGVSLRLGGVFRGGYVYVDTLDWLDNGYGRHDRYDERGVVRGIITGIDYRRDILTLRDEYSGRHIRVDMRRADRRSRRSVDMNDLRRGDSIALSGAWDRGVFEAYRIESVRTGRW
jgi:hypothetical protein